MTRQRPPTLSSTCLDTSESGGIQGPRLDDTFSVVRYKKSDRDAVFALLRAASSGAASDRLIRQWDWKYDTNPFFRDEQQWFTTMGDGDLEMAF